MSLFLFDLYFDNVQTKGEKHEQIKCNKFN